MPAELRRRISSSMPRWISSIASVRSSPTTSGWSCCSICTRQRSAARRRTSRTGVDGRCLTWLTSPTRRPARARRPTRSACARCRRKAFAARDESVSAAEGAARLRQVARADVPRAGQALQPGPQEGHRRGARALDRRIVCEHEADRARLLRRLGGRGPRTTSARRAPTRARSRPSSDFLNEHRHDARLHARDAAVRARRHRRGAASTTRCWRSTSSTMSPPTRTAASGRCCAR